MARRRYATKPQTAGRSCARLYRQSRGKLHHKVLKRGRKFTDLSPEDRHKVRLVLKRLRDIAGFFPSSLGRKNPRHRYERRLARFQEQLGRYNDMLIAEELVQQMLRKKLPAAGRCAVEALRDWQAAAHEDGEAKLRSAWKKFGETRCAARHPARRGYDCDGRNPSKGGMHVRRSF